MKQRNKLPTILFAALGMGLLILDAKTALQGAREGITLCIQTVIPSLFPFFVLSIALVGWIVGARIPGLRVLGRLCGIPEGAESLLLVGLLGGYPVGAQCISQAYHAGQLNRNDAHRMLGFCSNAGPAFLFGMAASLFRSAAAVWALWGIHILSALFVGLLLPGKSSAKVAVRSGSGLTLPQALERAVRVMAGVCGWVVSFRVILAILQRWCLWAVPLGVRTAITGLLELSNGCCELASLPGAGMRFLLCACFLGFGGLCVAMQTMSVTAGLGTGAYFPGKLMQGAFSLLMAAVVQQFLFPTSERAALSPAVWLLVPLGCCVMLFLRKKTVEIPRKLMYNGTR